MFLNDCGEWVVTFMLFIISVLYLTYFRAALRQMCATPQQKSQIAAAIVSRVFINKSCLLSPYLLVRHPHLFVFFNLMAKMLGIEVRCVVHHHF